MDTSVVSYDGIVYVSLEIRIAKYCKIFGVATKIHVNCSTQIILQFTWIFVMEKCHFCCIKHLSDI